MKNSEILDSWKAISAYLRRDIKTCYRWEKELGLPVHRIDEKSSRSKVFAYKSEIDLWLRGKSIDKSIAEKAHGRKNLWSKWLAATLGVLMVTSALVFVVFKNQKEYPLAFDEVEDLNSLTNQTSLSKDRVLERIGEGTLSSWQLYYQGKYFLGKNTNDANELAILLFLQAIERDENILVAYLGLARCYIKNIEFEWDLDKKWLDKAEELAKKSEDLPKKHPDYYSVLAKVRLLKYEYFGGATLDMAYQMFHKGLKEYPDYPLLNSIAGKYYYMKYGRGGEESDFLQALKFKEKAFWLDPYSLNNVAFSKLLMLGRRFQDATEVCQQIGSIDTSYQAKFCLGEIYYYSNDLKKSQDIFDQIQTPLKLKVASLFYKGMIASQMEDRKTIQSVIREIELLSPEESHFGMHLIKLSSMYFGMGQEEEGYRYLRSFFSNSLLRKSRFIQLRYIDIDRNFKDFKNNQKFLSIIRSDVN